MSANDTSDIPPVRSMVAAVPGVLEFSVEGLLQVPFMLSLASVCVMPDSSVSVAPAFTVTMLKVLAPVTVPVIVELVFSDRSL